MYRINQNCYYRSLSPISPQKIEVAKIEPDAYFESITVRIHASMKDYTNNRSGNVVDGSPHKSRTFSEYWTFIRRRGFSSESAATGEHTCPNCGAPLKVNMSGICAYCGSALTSGEFDWVLSLIEQDEAYAG